MNAKRMPRSLLTPPPRCEVVIRTPSMPVPVIDGLTDNIGEGILYSLESGSLTKCVDP